MTRTHTPNNKHHESAPWVRFALVVMLGMAALMGDVLTLEAIRTSAVAMAYAACLVLMLAATFASLGRSSRKRPTPDGLQPRPEPAWHIHRTFTDPLFQGPAAFCIFVLGLDLVSDLRAEPPTSQQAVWFLVAITLVAVVLLLEPVWKARQAAGVARLSHGQLQSEPPRRESAADPWFSIPQLAVGFVVFTRLGVRQIEEDPTSVATWVFFLLAPVAGAFTAVSGALRRRRRARGEQTPSPLATP